VGRKEQAEQSRAGLVDAARRCFTERGYEATTVAAILDRAGMARGALYHYFPDGKAQIFAAVYDDVDAALHRELDALDASGTHLARLRAGLALYLRYCLHDDFASIVVRAAPHVVPGQEWPRSAVGAGRSLTRIRGQLEAALAVGEIHPCDTGILAAAVYGATRELGAHIVAASDRTAAAREAVTVTDRLLDGIAVVPTTTRTGGASARTTSATTSARTTSATTTGTPAHRSRRKERT
jgi:AcrR family transcriptional regulator